MSLFYIDEADYQARVAARAAAKRKMASMALLGFNPPSH